MMSKNTRIWLVLAGFLVILGLLLFAAAMFRNRWDFKKLGTVQYETNTHEIGEDFRGISVESGTADIILKPSEDGSCTVVCQEPVNANHTVAVRDGVLTIRKAKEKPVSVYVGLDFSLKIWTSPSVPGMFASKQPMWETC